MYLLHLLHLLSLLYVVRQLLLLLTSLRVRIFLRVMVAWCRCVWVVRHNFDEDGNGVAADGLTGVMTGMMKAGVIRMTASGQILPSKKAPQRHRHLTGVDGRIFGHTDADVVGSARP
jgi:hypothetical protein